MEGLPPSIQMHRESVSTEIQELSEPVLYDELLKSVARETNAKGLLLSWAVLAKLKMI